MQRATALPPSKHSVHKHEGHLASLTWDCTATAAREPAHGVPPQHCPEVRQHAGLRLGVTSLFPCHLPRFQAEILIKTTTGGETRADEAH